MIIETVGVLLIILALYLFMQYRQKAIPVFLMMIGLPLIAPHIFVGLYVWMIPFGVGMFLFGLYLLFRHKQKNIPIAVTISGFLLMVVPFIFARLYFNPLG